MSLRILFVTLGFESFPSDQPRVKGLNLVRVEYFQWCLVIVLSGVDATLGDGCESWEYLHSFKEVK